MNAIFQPRPLSFPYFRTFIILSLLVLQPSSIFSQATGDTLLDQYISRALNVSPRIRALVDKRYAIESRIPQLSNLPDPRISFSLNNLPVNSFGFSQEPMTGKKVTLSQEIPYPGKLSARADMGREDERIAGREIEDLLNEVTRNVKRVYFHLIYLNEAVRIQEQAREVLRGFSQTVRKKYEVGKGSQQDILKSDMEISRITDRLLKLEDERQSRMAEINALLLFPPDTMIRIDTLTRPVAYEITETLLLERARENRPLLLGLENAQNKARIQKRLADLAWYPNIMIGAGYTQREFLKSSGSDLVDFVSFSVGMNIPLNIGGKRSAAGEEAESLERMYGSQYESVLQQLQKIFGNSIAGLNSILARLNLLETGLLPQASQAFNASLAGYQVGEVDYLTVLDNLGKLFQMETDLYRLRADYWKEIADVEFFTGKGQL